MAVRKRGNRFFIDYYEPGGRRIQKGGFKLKKDAVAEEAKRKSLIAEGRYLDAVKDFQTTFDELAEKYIENIKYQRSFERSKRYMIETLQRDFAGRLLKSISYLDLETYRNKSRGRLTKHGRFPEKATVNRYMACLRHMLSKAVEWDMLDRNPFDKGRSLQFKENNARTRYLDEVEINRVLAECPTQPANRQKGRFIQGTQAVHLKDFVVVSINTGMRKGEVLSLQWDQIQGGFIYIKKSKTDLARQIPINDDLRECFKSIRKRQGLGVKYVICTDKGRRIKDIRTAFKSAMKRAGVANVRPHDLRHTFASHYVMRGGSLRALQKVLGHADLKMTMRYAHLSKEFAKEEIQLLNGLTSDKKKADESRGDPGTLQKSDPAIAS